MMWLALTVASHIYIGVGAMIVFVNAHNVALESELSGVPLSFIVAKWIVIWPSKI